MIIYTLATIRYIKMTAPNAGVCLRLDGLSVLSKDCKCPAVYLGLPRHSVHGGRVSTDATAPFHDRPDAEAT